MPPEYHLLIAVIVDRLSEVPVENLKAAINDWAEDQSQSLLDWLNQQGCLQPARIPWIEEEANRWVQALGGAEAALAALIDGEQINRLFDSVVNPSIQDIISSYNTMTGEQSLRRFVAMKLLRQEHCSNNRSRRRFQFEVEVTGQIQHKGIAHIYDAGNEAGQPFYVMQLWATVTFTRAIEELHQLKGKAWQAQLRELLRRFLAVCETVSYAHSQQILHRDLKPGNILIGAFGETFVIDWGIARRLEVSGGQDAEVIDENETEISEDASMIVTQYGRSIGTLGYWSPEAARGERENISFQSDVYSLGAILYALLSGYTLKDAVKPQSNSQIVISEPVPPKKRKKGASSPNDLNGI